MIKLKKKYTLLSKEETRINKKGKFTGVKIKMLDKEGLAVGPQKRLLVRPQILNVLESLISSGCHYVLQSSEGDGIKLTGKDGLTRCVILIRSGVMQTFNLKANTAMVRTILKKIGIPENDVNIRKQSKSEYVYTDFSEQCKPEHIVNFILELPPSSTCSCGHTKDLKKNLIKVAA